MDHDPNRPIRPDKCLPLSCGSRIPGGGAICRADEKGVGVSCARIWVLLIPSLLFSDRYRSLKMSAIPIAMAATAGMRIPPQPVLMSLGIAGSVSFSRS